MIKKAQEPFKRGAGILLPVSSLPSDYGIGTFGKEAYKFVDFLRGAGQKYWQVLPLGPISYGDSPYSTSSAFASNPYYIDLEELIVQGLLRLDQVKSVNWGNVSKEVDYSILHKERFSVLKIAYNNSQHKTEEDYLEFCKENSFWLNDYGLYMAIKRQFNGKEWLRWPEEIMLRDPQTIDDMTKELQEEIDFWKFCQYKLYSQWFKLKKYANDNGIQIIGDIPIYVAFDSADVWVNHNLFDLDEMRRPRHIAGVPPDMFSEAGQLWGNPIYDWEEMVNEDFEWWKARIKNNAKLYDVIRIDHFIGIVNYYSIPAQSDTAKTGKWVQGPSEKLINAINEAVGDRKIIAEDLGNVTPEVRRVLKDSGYPGMKLLQMAFFGGSDNDNLPFNYDANCVVYGGTHDNETLKDFFKNQSKEITKYAMDFLNIKRKRRIPWSIINCAYQSVGNTVIIQMQDFLGLDNSARINTPSTIGGNWKWRLKKGQITKKLESKIKKITTLYGR